MKFVVATRHFAGLGFAMRLQAQGHDVVMAYTGIDDRAQPRYDLVGKGIVTRRPLSEIMADRAAQRDWWFFEKCERFGYNSHPNLLWTLNRDSLGVTLASIADRTFTPNFSPGFGASCSMYMVHPRSGKAVLFPEDVARDLYFYDLYRDESGELLTAGYHDDVLIATAFDYTIPTSWEKSYQVARAVKSPGRAFRTDGGGTDSPSLPLRRYEALHAMGYLWLEPVH